MNVKEVLEAVYNREISVEEAFSIIERIDEEQLEESTRIIENEILKIAERIAKRK